jgi:hypothetical protein
LVVLWSTGDPSIALCDSVSSNPAVLIPAAVVGGATVIGIAGNTGDLITGGSSRAGAYFGLVTGALSVTFGFLVSEYEPIYDEWAPFLGVTGLVALGLGVVNLYKAPRSDDSEEYAERVTFEPMFRGRGSDRTTGVVLRLRF